MPVQVQEQGGLAGTVGPEQRHAFTLRHAEAYPAQRLRAVVITVAADRQPGWQRSFPPARAHGVIDALGPLRRADKELAHHGGQRLPAGAAPRVNVRLARARRMRSASSASTNR